jgi:hypothetical protein
MEQMTALSTLSLLDTTKEQRSTFVQSVINGLKEGNTDPLTVHKQVKCVEDLVKQLTDNKEYKSIILVEAEKHGKNYETHNAKFSIMESGVKYDYSQCNDNVYNALQQLLADAKAGLADRENFLKSLPISGMDLLTVDGEVVTVYPPTKTSTTTVSVKLK